MTPRPWLSRRNRRDLGVTLILSLLSLLALPTLPAAAGANLVANGGLESVGADGFPVCWERSGWGDSPYTFDVTAQAHTGARAMQITLAQTAAGDRKAMMLENPSCAPNVSPGHQYDLSVWYTTTTPNTAMKPMADGTDRYCPVTNRPTMPPMMANGTLAMMRVACRTELKAV